MQRPQKASSRSPELLRAGRGISHATEPSSREILRSAWTATTLRMTPLFLSRLSAARCAPSCH